MEHFKKRNEKLWENWMSCVGYTKVVALRGADTVNFTQMSSEFSHEFGLIYHVNFQILFVHIHTLFSLHLD